ncbi:MAG: DUF4292 domain-containing protein [Chloroherpetonaceae bacterium]|nr:DUF4292 domain-containing protein [Chloroherpetonaceae bacterium]
MIFPKILRLCRARVVSIALAVCVLGCRTPREISKPDLAATSETRLDARLLELFAKATANAADFKTMRGYGTMQIRSPELDQRLNCALRIKRGEAMQLTGSVFFGITAFDALIRADSVFLYSPLEKRLYVGANSPANLQRITGLSASFADLLDAFLGLPRIDTNAAKLYKVATGEGKVAFFLKNGALDEVVEINPETETIESLRALDASGKTVGAILFKSFERLSPNLRPLPKEIELVAYDYPNDSSYVARQLLLRYDERELNPDDFRFTFEPSKRAKAYRIEQFQMRLRR